MVTMIITRGEGTVTSGSGGSTPSKAPLESHFPAAGATLGAMNTTQMLVGTGTLTDIHAEAFNVQVGLLYQPTPEERIWISPSDRIAVEVGAHDDAMNISATIVWEEFGG
jgi:hypothetical protein